MLKFDLVLASAPFVGHSGYNSHSQNFFTALDNYIPVRVKNYTHCNELDHLTQKQKDMIIHQTWSHIPWEVGTPFNPKPGTKIVNICLFETNHVEYYKGFDGPKIAYNVWESTLQPWPFFSRLLQFDQLWVPTTWQANCSIEQGYPADRVKIVPEGVNGFVFYPYKTANKKNGKFQFMIFGRWDYRKYSMEMVKAFHEEFGPDEPVELILSADNPYPVDKMNSTEERLKYYGFDKNENIIIKHFPSRDEYVNYIRTGDCLLNVSRSEGWGLPPCESLASGTPTMVLNWGAHLDFCKPDGGAIFVDVKELKKPENVFMQGDVPGLWGEPDFGDLKKKMRYVFENREECKKKAVDGSEWVRSEFSWSNAAKKAFEIISEIDVTKYYPVKLNLGSGEFRKDGYINIDKYYPTADEKADAKSLPYPNESVQEINASHLLEHFNKFEIEGVLREWFRVLKFDGRLIIEIPDFEWCVKNWLEKDDKWGFPLDTIFGLQDKPGEEHKVGFTRGKILELLAEVGFSNIIFKEMWSHEQQCFRITARKEKIEYNDDIFVIDTYPNTPEKEQILLETIDRVAKTGKPIALVSHIGIPSHILDKVNYFIYDSNNRKSHDYSLTLWHTVPKKVKVITHLDNTYHGLSCLSSIKNSAAFLSSKYNFIHFIEYDMNADFEKYLELVNEKRRKNKKFIGFDYHHDTPKQDGIITNLFSTDPKWMNERLEEYDNWDVFFKRAHEIATSIGKTPDMILEHWMWNYFLYKDMMKDSHIFPQDMEESIVTCGNMMDQLEEEPEVKVKLSETTDSRIGVFLMRDSRSKEYGDYKIYYTPPNDELNKIQHVGHIFPGDVNYHFFPKEGTIEVHWGRNSTKIFEIDPNEIYKDTVFRFYDDSVHCISWNHQDDEGFMWQPGDRDTIEFSFVEKPKIEILGNSQELYQLKFIDGDTNITRFESTITPNHWSACNFNYFINWRNEVYLNDKLVASHNFDPTGKRVKVKLDSKAIGDTIAWFPYIEEFRKKYDCDMYAGTFHNYLFKENYPEIHFIDPDQSVENLYASYNVGARDNDYESNKNNWRVVPLQQVSSDYLGLEYKEIRPKIVVPNKKRPIDKKYVTITEHSTIQCKYWLYKNGWQDVVDYLISKGYIVVVVSKEKTNLKNVVKYINRPMEDTINTIYHSDFFMGISTGPTWLAWAMEVPTVLISGYSALWGEMKDCVRIGAPEGKCSGCFNDKDLFFDRGNWNWCPKSKNMECTTSITSKEVIDRIQPLIK